MKQNYYILKITNDVSSDFDISFVIFHAYLNEILKLENQQCFEKFWKSEHQMCWNLVKQRHHN